MLNLFKIKCPHCNQKCVNYYRVPVFPVLCKGCGGLIKVSSSGIRKQISLDIAIFFILLPLLVIYTDIELQFLLLGYVLYLLASMALRPISCPVIVAQEEELHLSEDIKKRRIRNLFIRQCPNCSKKTLKSFSLFEVSPKCPSCKELVKPSTWRHCLFTTFFLALWSPVILMPTFLITGTFSYSILLFTLYLMLYPLFVPMIVVKEKEDSSGDMK